MGENVRFLGAVQGLWTEIWDKGTGIRTTGTMPVKQGHCGGSGEYSDNVGNTSGLWGP